MPNGCTGKWMQRFADPPNSVLTNDCNGATVRKPEGAGESLNNGEERAPTIECDGGRPRNETERRAEQKDEYPTTL